MTLLRDGRFERTDIWREGKWLDLWSVVHFLSGMSMGFCTSLVGFGVPESIIINFLLLVAYEMWEAMVQIHETPQNRVMDVVVGMVSFLPTFLFVAPSLSGAAFILVFGITFTVNITMAAFGWLASRKAIELEIRLRQELKEQREKFKARRARFLADRKRRREEKL